MHIDVVRGHFRGYVVEFHVRGFDSVGVENRLYDIVRQAAKMRVEGG